MPIHIDSTAGRRTTSRMKSFLLGKWGATRRRFWLSAGFNEAEVEYALRNNVAVTSDRARYIARHRKVKVGFYMRQFGYSRDAAIARCYEERREKAIREGEDEDAIWYEPSP